MDEDMLAAEWCSRRGFHLIPEDYEATFTRYAWPDSETEVRWGRAFEEMRVDVMGEIMNRDFGQELHHKYQEKGPYRHIPSIYFMRKYPELDGLLY
jgi:hypothetical protein